VNYYKISNRKANFEVKKSLYIASVLTDHQKNLRKSIRQRLVEQAEKNSAAEIEVEIFDLLIDLDFHDWQMIHSPEYFAEMDSLKKKLWYRKAYMLKTLKAYHRNKKENPGR